VVLLEIGAGDLAVAQKRLAFAQEIPRLDLPPEGVLLSREILRRTGLSKKAGRDALHIAIAAVHGMDFLVTWNCSHIANAFLIPRIVSIIEERGLRSPVICTPPQLAEY
jgi:hypothetical protein